MYIPNDDTQNYPFCKLQLVVEISGHPTFNKANWVVPKIVMPTNKKTLYKNFWD